VSMPRRSPTTHTVRLEASTYGFGSGRLLVDAPVDERPFLMVSAAMLHRHGERTAEIERATHRFVTILATHDRIDTGSKTTPSRTANARRANHRHATHSLVRSADGLRLVRQRFICGRP